MRRRSILSQWNPGRLVGFTPQTHRRRDSPSRRTPQDAPMTRSTPIPERAPERAPAPAPRLTPVRDGANAYVCRTCRGVTMIRHADPGYAPNVLMCRATKSCAVPAVSRFYPFSFAKPIPTEWASLPVWEWYAPADDDPALEIDGMRDYVRRGGLVLRGPLSPDWPIDLVAP